MKTQRLSAFFSQLRSDQQLRERALQADDCDSMAAFARSLGYELTAADLLRYQAEWVLSQTEADLNEKFWGLRVRHWGCWLDAV